MANRKIGDGTLVDMTDSTEVEVSVGGATQLKTNGTRIISYIQGAIPDTQTEVLTISGDGQTAFTLSDTPAAPEKSILSLNGQIREYTVDFTISGTALTWNDPGGLTLKTTDALQIWYNVSLGAGSSVTSVFTRTGDVTAQASDYDASQVENDSSVTGDFVSDALDQLDTDITTHTSAANPHSGSAASGANSDITSITGLTTALAISQGGTNSSTALTNDKVMISSGGAIVESSVDATKLPTTYSLLCSPDYNSNYNNRRVRSIGGSGSFRFPFYVPKHFLGILTVKLIGYPVSGAGGAGRDIDLAGEYTLDSGDSATQYTFSETTSTYDTGTDDTRWEQDITSLFTNLAAGADGGIFVDHNSIGGTINYIGVEITSD